MRSLLGWTGAAIVLVGFSMVPVPDRAIALPGQEDPFCHGGALRDYAAPLDRLPTVREVPASGKLPFAPRRISFYKAADSVVRSGESIGYAFDLEGMEFGGRRLDWDIESRLVRIDRRGRGGRIVKRRRQTLGLIEVARKNLGIGFDRSPQPGLYRFDVSFVDRAEKLLGSYHSYHRVVRRSLDIRLRLNGTTFRSGDQVLGRVENFGTESLFYGMPYWLQGYDGEHWVPVSLWALYGHRVGFIKILLGTAPGLVGPCSATLSISAGMSPGRYRLVKSVDVGSDRIRLNRSRFLTAGFEVTE